MSIRMASIFQNLPLFPTDLGTHHGNVARELPNLPSQPSENLRLCIAQIQECMQARSGYHQYDQLFQVLVQILKVLHLIVSMSSKGPVNRRSPLYDERMTVPLNL